MKEDMRKKGLCKEDAWDRSRWRRTYNEMKMKYNEHPAIFLTNFKEHIDKMVEAGVDKREGDYLSDIPAKIPGPKKKD